MSNKQNIPAALLKDCYWKSLIYLFSNHDKLQTVFTPEFIDLNARLVKGDQLKRKARPWSQSEKFMLNVALAMYNGTGKPDLNDMDFLDRNSVQLVLDAMAMRYKNAPYKG